MNPIYFGISPKTLFGIYHRPPGRSVVREDCIVLCYPMAHEYAYVHRAFRQLATRLAKNGFHVLRFDYYGFGDSAGDSEESDINQWTEDISVAIEEIKSISGLSKVSLIGFRLGATALALSTASRNDVERIILWEPIVNGVEYVEELFVLHDTWVSENVSGNDQGVSSNGVPELIGMPFSQRMNVALENVDLLKLSRKLARHTLTLDNSRQPKLHSLKGVLDSSGNTVEYRQAQTPDSWDGGAGIDSIQVPGQALNLIISWISGERV